MKWYQSRTIWSAVASLICLILAPILHMRDEDVKTFTDTLMNDGPEVGAAIATVLTIFFRVKSQGEITNEKK